MRSTRWSCFCLMIAASSLCFIAGAQQPGSPCIASGVAPEPAIHGPRVLGTTPGRPFLFLIPATGDGPLQFAAKGLPHKLTLDAKTGIISGVVAAPGKTNVTLEVRGAHRAAKRKLTIIAGEGCLAQTPPMGWNSWNIWSRDIDDAKVRDAADWMVKSGLAAHGYQYINIDDAWEGVRDANGEIQTNSRFPDMKALSDYIHSKGLKFGIYSSPGAKTCADYEGSLGHEEQDAKTFAKWGVDYLKYDWCSYKIASANMDEMQRPFRVMGEALAKLDRDIIYSASQGGIANIREWGPEAGLHLWRTTGDIRDTWESVATIGFGQSGNEPFAGPGHWNDPDMLVVGAVKWGKGDRTHLTPDEQITHISLWSLLAAPLIVGCDMSKLDPFTTDLLTNDEVIDVDQDPLGKQASRVARYGSSGIVENWLKGTGLVKPPAPSAYGEVWARPLSDGTLAVGLFNLGPVAGPIAVQWSALGLSGAQPVRDLWLRKDLGEVSDAFTAEIPSHGAVLLKIGRAKS